MRFRVLGSCPSQFTGRPVQLLVHNAIQMYYVIIPYTSCMMGHELSTVLTQSASTTQPQIDLHQTQSINFLRDGSIIVHREISRLNCGKVVIGWNTVPCWFTIMKYNNGTRSLSTNAFEHLILDSLKWPEFVSASEQFSSHLVGYIGWRRLSREKWEKLRRSDIASLVVRSFHESC